MTYFWPAFFYLAVLNYVTFALTIGEGGKGIIVFILFFTLLFFIALITLYRKYMLLSLFLIVYPDLIVLRNNITSYYFTLSIVDKIEYILVSGRFKYIVFVTNKAERIKINLSYFRNTEKNDIRDQLNTYEHIEKQTKRVQRRSRPGSASY